MSGVSLPQRAWTALAGAAFVAFFATSCATAASSQTLFGGWFERDRVLFGQSAPYGQALPQTEQPNADGELAPAPQRQIVPYPGKEAPGTVIVDTPHTFLYLTLGGGKAVRYGIGVGRRGFTWSGVERISRKSEWPDWIPPAEMIARQPYLPRWVGGGPGNPLGARRLSHSRHQQSGLDRHASLQRLHPHAQRRCHRSLSSRVGRHEGDRAARRSAQRGKRYVGRCPSRCVDRAQQRRRRDDGADRRRPTRLGYLCARRVERESQFTRSLLSERAAQPNGGVPDGCRQKCRRSALCDDESMIRKSLPRT
jgi:lipoprotein-anchoring transpeptidase ErfK/SrfK